MNKFQAELQELKPHDEIQTSRPVGRGYHFIVTASHGYLVVPKTDPYYPIAERICSYGFIGELATYLEEDCEAYDFMKSLPA